MTVREILMAASGGKIYATWNPLDKASGLVLTDGNLGVSSDGGAIRSVRATLGKSSGKWYWETKGVTGTINGVYPCGVMSGSSSVNTFPGGEASSYLYSSTSLKYNSGGSSYAAAYSSGDIIGVLLDMDTGSLSYYKNGVSQGVAFTGLSGLHYPAAGTYVGYPGTLLTNFGATAFTYPVPSGYNAGLYV